MYAFINVSNFRFSGITTINSNNWTICFADSDNVLVENNILLGYRTYSDGIMLSDCQDSLVRNNFVRTGDDAIEVKSTRFEGATNLIFEYNDVWTDKARGYGCIYECENSVKNIVFRNNSIGFALATWADYIGCCVITMGNNRATLWEDVHFENIEIYITYHPVINVTLHDDYNNGSDGGKAKDIYFENINAHKVYGVAVRIYVENGSELGNVFLDDICYNGVKLKESDILSSESVSITHYDPLWYSKGNIKVDSIVGD